MLRELRIENLLLIERAELRLGPGLNVLTGETGAGKTVLAHSLDLLMGGKARNGIVRPGAREAWVEGVFDLPVEWRKDPELAEVLERIPEDAEEVVLGRRVSESGRTSAFLAGRSASAADLQLLSSRLITFYGQHEHRRLTISSSQLTMVDAAAGEKQSARLEAYASVWAERRRLAKELDDLVNRDRARERDLDLHRFELEEIESAAPSTDEKAGLESDRQRLRHADRLRIATSSAADRLTGSSDPDSMGEGSGEGALGDIASAGASLSDVRGVDPELDVLIDRVESALIEVTDLGAGIREYGSTIDADPERLLAIEERLDVLDRLERKHGGSIEKVLEHAEWCRNEIAQLEGGEEREEALRADLEAAEAALEAAALELTKARRKAAKELSAKVTADIAELSMEGASLEIELVERPEGLAATGAESVEFMLAPNRGMSAQPLRESASGGELSRVMLALAGSANDRPERILVFDEIDAGIGGNTATAVGERLRTVADSRQVLAITHLPQVASRAESHFTITKDPGRETAAASVTELEGESLIEEIRRMMGADSQDEAATRHARELVAANR